MTSAIKAAMPTLVNGITAEVGKIVSKNIMEATNKLANEKMAEEKLLPLSEAGKRLKVNAARLRSMAANGDLIIVKTRGGRSKVIESSLNAYIASLGA